METKGKAQVKAWMLFQAATQAANATAAGFKPGQINRTNRKAGIQDI
jgi:hypothetical protein